MAANDYQVGGTHYKFMDVQPWEAMESWLTKDQFIGFLRGNVIKYVARAGRKGKDSAEHVTADQANEDLKKAMHYLEKLLEVLSAETR